MEINENITVNLSPQDVSSIIKEYLTNKGYQVENVLFDVKTRTEGYFTHEYSSTYFAGVNCKVTRK